MNRRNEDWKSAEFDIKDFTNYWTITKNNKEILKELNLPFVTYNAN